MAQAALISRVGFAVGGLRHVQQPHQELAAVRQVTMPAGLGLTRINADRRQAGVAVKTFALFGSNKAKAKTPVPKKV